MAPAIDPANATCGSVISGKGVTTRFETLYAAKRRELTAAIPTKGLAIPVERTVSRLLSYKGPILTLIQREYPLVAHCLYQDVHRPFLRDISQV